MKNIFATAGLVALLTTPVFAQEEGADAEAPPPAPTAEEVDASVAAINALAENEEKVATYCEILVAEDSLEEGDSAASEAVAEKFDAFYADLSDDARMAFDIDETIDPASAKAQELGGAFLNLEDQCSGDDTTDG